LGFFGLKMNHLAIPMGSHLPPKKGNFFFFVNRTGDESSGSDVTASRTLMVDRSQAMHPDEKFHTNSHLGM
jgi:hypothetical protein